MDTLGLELQGIPSAVKAFFDELHKQHPFVPTHTPFVHIIHTQEEDQWHVSANLQFQKPVFDRDVEAIIENHSKQLQTIARVNTEVMSQYLQEMRVAADRVSRPFYTTI